MKIKTSITLSAELLKLLDKMQEFNNRSQAIEAAVKEFITSRQRKKRDLKDLAILNQHADYFNKEAQEFLDYQVPL